MLQSKRGLGMKIAVCVKQAADIPAYVELTPDGRDVDAAFLSFEVNEADTYAVEEALRLADEGADAGSEVEVVVLTAGDDEAEEALRTCLAMGANAAVRVVLKRSQTHDPVAVARALAGAVAAQQPDLVLCGVQSSDAAQQSTGPALAAALEMPSVSVVTGLDVAAGSGTVTARREFEGGLSEQVEVDGPAVLSVQTGLNTPRYGSFKGKMRAKKAQIEVDEPAPSTPRTTVRRMFVPEDGDGRAVRMIEGGPDEVAARIVELIREMG